MEIFKIYNHLDWPILAVLLFGLFGSFGGLLRAITSRIRNKPIKVPYLSLSSLVISLCFFLISKSMMISAITQYAIDSDIQIEVRPPPTVDSSVFFKSIVSNLSRFKQSGSQPTDKIWMIYIFKDGSCIPIELARDSRDMNLYWVTYKPKGLGIPLGYSTLTGKLNGI